MVIAGDVGGTKTVLAKAELDGGKVRLDAEQRFTGNNYSSFTDVLRAYFHQKKADAARGLCLGVAGPVQDGTAHMTNLDWKIDARALAEEFSIEHVAVLNDLELSGYGLDLLPEDGLRMIHDGQPRKGGNRALISAGTGLGLTIIPCVNGVYYPQPSEGGHAGFAPFDGESERLWEDIRHDGKNVSIEDVLSGPGLCRIFDFLRKERGIELSEEMQKELQENEGEAISSWALEGKKSPAEAAVNLFLDIYASEAGNVALKGLATGGVYLGGGILPSLVPLLDKRRFLRHFTTKGKMADLLRTVPIYIVTDTKLPLYGAAAYSERIRQST